jgi:Protein of unknown function (DUF4435)
MPLPHPDSNEIVALLKKSNLITVLVEGTADVVIYRWLEKRFEQSIDLVHCGGRNTLIEVYKRRLEFSSRKVVFLADQDLWVHSIIPPEFSDIVFTSGYSIENDIFAGSNLEGLLDDKEMESYYKDLDLLIHWYAFEVEQYRTTGYCEVATNINRILKSDPQRICEVFKADRNFQDPDPVTVDDIRNDYKIKFRGKTLFDTLWKYLNTPNRWAKHKKESLYETAVKLFPDNIYVLDLVSRVNMKI